VGAFGAGFAATGNPIVANTISSSAAVYTSDVLNGTSSSVSDYVSAAVFQNLLFAGGKVFANAGMSAPGPVSSVPPAQNGMAAGAGKPAVVARSANQISASSISNPPFGGGKYFFRGDNAYSGGNVGTKLVAKEVEAKDIINQIKGNKAGDPFTSFSLKAARGSEASRGAGFFGDTVLKVRASDLDDLVASGQVRILSPADVRDFLSTHAKAKFRRRANEIYANMLRNNEVLIQGELPGSIVELLQ